MKKWKIVKSLEESGLLVKGISKGGFLQLVTLAASLLGVASTGRGVIRAGEDKIRAGESF